MSKKKAPKKEVAKQLPLGLKHPFLNMFKDIQNKFLEKFTIFELYKFSKDLQVWGLLSAIFSLTLYQLYIIFENLGHLPKVLPILQTITSDKGKLLTTNYLYLIPASSILILILSYILSYKFYDKHKELVLYFLLISTITTVVITISLLKIIS